MRSCAPEAGTSNYIPQTLWAVITCPCPWYLILAHKSSYIYSPCSVCIIRLLRAIYKLPTKCRNWCFVVLNRGLINILHSDNFIMETIASQITSLPIVYSAVYWGADQRKHQSSASLAFVRVIHRGPVNSPHKWPVTGKMFPFDDIIMNIYFMCTRTMPFGHSSFHGAP